MSQKWTREDYDKAVENLDLEPGHDLQQQQFGVSALCPFNCLESFHCIDQFPVDALHDFCEKVGPCDALSVLKVLINQGLFTMEQYNRMLLDLRLESYETSDRPPPINLSSKKLPGKAMAISLHIRVMPYLLWRLGVQISENDEILEFLAILHQINEFVLADSINLADIHKFEGIIIEFFAKRKSCKEKYTTFIEETPKYHYLVHYGSQMENFGPLTSFWTARAEGKHRKYVNYAESAKNFKNIVKTLAMKDQKLLASR